MVRNIGNVERFATRIVVLWRGEKRQYLHPLIEGNIKGQRRNQLAQESDRLGQVRQQPERSSRVELLPISDLPDGTFVEIL